MAENAGPKKAVDDKAVFDGRTYQGRNNQREVEKLMSADGPSAKDQKEGFGSRGYNEKQFRARPADACRPAADEHQRSIAECASIAGKNTVFCVGHTSSDKKY